MKRIGYWVSEKKLKKLNFEDNRERYRDAGLELVKIDLSRSLEDQGPFDIIVHKLTDILVRAREGHTIDKLFVRHFKEYVAKHPEVVVVDSLDNVSKLMNRFEQYEFVKQCRLSNSDFSVFTPTFVELTLTDVEINKKKLKEANVKYPFVCKPLLAHGPSTSHEMAVIFSEEGLQDVKPPCVAQTFINHNAVLYKVYVIGDEQFIDVRPSLKKLSAGNYKTIFFHSSDVSKPDSSHLLNEMDHTPKKPDTAKLKTIGAQFKSMLNMSLFGVDVIKECGTNRYSVIDINAFPGYDSVDHFFDILKNYLLKLLDSRQCPRKSVEYKRSQKCVDIDCKDSRHKRLKVHNMEVEESWDVSVGNYCKDCSTETLALRNGCGRKLSGEENITDNCQNQPFKVLL